MAGIEALIAAGQTDEDKIAAMTRALRGQQTMGNILSLAPDQYINKLGTQMSSSAREGATSYGKQRGTALEKARLQRNSKRDFEANENQRTVENRVAREKYMSNEGNRAMLQQNLQDKQGWQNFYDPKDHTKRVSALVNEQSGAAVDQKGEPVDLTDWVKGNPTKLAKTVGGKGSAAVQKAQLKKDASLISALDSVDKLEKVVMSDDLGSITGAYSPTAWLAEKGLGYEGGDRQGLVKRSQDVIMESIAKNLEPLGINPTDLDLILAKAPLPDTNTQPEAWVDWVEDFSDRLNRQVKRARADGRDTISAEDMTKYTAKLENLVKRARAKWKDRNAYEVFMDNPNFKGSGQDQFPMEAQPQVQAPQAQTNSVAPPAQGAQALSPEAQAYLQAMEAEEAELAAEEAEIARLEAAMGGRQ